MATEPEAAQVFNTWRLDPASGNFIDVNAPDAEGRSIGELSDGRYSVVGSTVRDSSTGRIVGNLSTVHGSTLSVGDQGDLFLNNGIGREDINQAGGRSVMQRASITVTIPGEEGADPTVLSGVTSLTQFGGGIYTIQGMPRGPADFERVDLVPDSTTEREPRRFNLPLSVGLYRRATPSETLNRSVTGWLARNAFAEIAARVAGIGGASYAERTSAIADAIDALGITVEVAPFVTYNLSAG